MAIHSPNHDTTPFFIQHTVTGEAPVNRQPSLRAALSCLFCICMNTGLATPVNTAELTVTREVIRSGDEFHAIGTQGFAAQGPVVWGANNLIKNGGCEPQEKRALRRITKIGEDSAGTYFQFDQDGTSNYLQWGSGKFSGTSFRAYRFHKDHKEFLGTYTIPARGSDGLPHGGWVAEAPAEWAAFKKMSKKEIAAMKEKWRCYYKGDGPQLKPNDMVVFARRTNTFTPEDMHPRKASASGVSVVHGLQMGSRPKLFIIQAQPQKRCGLAKPLCR